MITHKPLASAMMVPTRQVTIPTSAGRSVRFTSGIATIMDTNDLPYLLKRSDVKLMISEFAMSWMGDVMARTPKVLADVHWPADWAVEEHNGHWHFASPEPDPPFPPEPVPDPIPTPPNPPPSPEPNPPTPPYDPDNPDPPAALDEALKGKPRWRKPPAS